MSNLPGYAGKILRVDLSSGTCRDEVWDEATTRKWLGGTGLGAKHLYDEVPPGVEWDNPENRIILASGPLGGTRVQGTGTFSVVTKGPLTNGATSSQANGHFGAYLKFSGYDAIVVQGVSPKLVYLLIDDGRAELRDGSHLAGADTWENEDRIKAELGKGEHDMSVFGIGPAGENLVKFAAIVGDRGHVAGHNGTGAVMGSKHLKAIAAGRGTGRIAVKDAGRMQQLSRAMFEELKNDPIAQQQSYGYGTLNLYVPLEAMGVLPVKNYTTSVYPDRERLMHFTGPYMREKFSAVRHPCWACGMHHCHRMRVPEGPFAGAVTDEPEYEGLAAWGSQIGNYDVNSSVYLSDLADKLGVDTNAAGWVMGWCIECFERGIFTAKDTDGLEMRWGNVDAAREMLLRIAHRRGFGDFLAEGVKSAAFKTGDEAAAMGVYTMKGGTPRGHDHRANWSELFDTVVSSTGTLEAGWGLKAEDMAWLGLTPFPNPFDPMDISARCAKLKGFQNFEDSLGVCNFTSHGDLTFLVNGIAAATGWDYTREEAAITGERITNLMKAFNLRHGIGRDLDRPSPRYGSAPVDGPAAGVSILTAWEDMLRNYYTLLGWDVATSKPLPETLKRLGLEDVVPHLWG